MTYSEIKPVPFRQTLPSDNFEYLDMVAELSARFIRIPLDEINAGITDALGRLCKLLEADRGYIFQFIDDTSSNTHEWCSQGVEPQIDKLQDIPADATPWWVEQMNVKGLVTISDVRNMPLEAAKEQALFKSQDIRSLLNVVMAPMGFSVWGYIGLDRIHRPGPWQEKEITLVKIIGEIFANALERFHRENDMRNLQQYLLNILNSMPSVLMAVDETGRITQWNKTAEKKYGILLEDVQGHLITDILPRLSKVMEKIPESIRTGKALREHKSAFPQEGWVRYEDITIFPLMESDVAGAVIRIDDITDKIYMEERVSQNEKMLSLGTLAGGIAHDFNNILSGIFGFSQLARKNIDDAEKAGQHIDQVVKGARRASELVQQILTFSRQTEYRKFPCKIYHEVGEALKLLRSSIPSTVNIVKILQSKSAVLADPIKIHQVVMNLCTNAYHAMSEAGGDLTISLTDMEMKASPFFRQKTVLPGHYLKLAVTDTGTGMDKETFSKAFDPYFTTKKADQGTGLGLAVVQAIVDEHGGYIDIDSQPGKGTTVTVLFPIIRQAREAPPPLTRDGQNLAGTETIMIVDDEEEIRQVYQELFESYGYRVVVCKNGTNALDLFRAGNDRTDLIITDMTMPGLTGDKLARAVLAEDPSIPIILSTGFNECISEARAIQLGIRKFVQKPILNEDLLLMVRDLLDGK